MKLLNGTVKIHIEINQMFGFHRVFDLTYI